MQPLKRFAAILILGLGILSLGLTAPGFAVRPDEMLKDPALETRARAISAELRCLVCQNQSIDDSDADLAHDLRVLVRDRLSAGDSDAAVMDYLVQRYGEFILLRPVFSPGNALLWTGPFLIVLAGAGVLAFRTRRKPGPEARLTDAEEAKLRELNDF